MHIESISISNFENLEGSWDFGKVTELKGRNGAGKSAILRAIGWCLTGLDAYGQRSTDHIMRDPKKPTSVKLSLKGGSVVERNKTLHRHALTIDGAPVDMGHFGDPHLILSSLVPGHFQNLDEKKKRQLFMDLLPSVDIAAIFQERTGLDQKARGAMGIVFNDPLVTPEKLHKRWASTRLNKQKELEQLKGGENELALRVQELERKLKEAQASEDGVDLGELERRGKNLQAGLLGLKDKAKAHQEWEQKDAVYQSKAEDRKQYQDQVDNALDGLTPEQLTEQMENMAKEVERLEEIRDTHQEWENKVSYFAHMKEECQDLLTYLDKGKCFTCESKLGDKKVNHLRAQLMDDAKEPGKEPPKPKGLHEAQEHLQSLKDRYSLGREFTGFLETRPLPPSPGQAPCELPDQHQIEDLEETLRGVRNEYAAAKASIKATKETIENQHVQARNDLQANKDLQVEVSGQVERLQAVEDALHPARGVFAESLAIQLKTVQDLLPSWEFELTETAKTTGNARPCFQEYLHIADKGNHYHRVPLRYCSAGQQLAAGVDLCRALDTLNGDKLAMVFVDNCELLSKDVNLAGEVLVQSFRCTVDDQDLAVEVLAEA